MKFGSCGKALITDKVKPGILSSTFHFPEMMLNLIALPFQTHTGSPPTPASVCPLL